MKIYKLIKSEDRNTQNLENTYLNQEPQVDILALWLLPVYLAVLVVPDVNSLER